MFPCQIRQGSTSQPYSILQCFTFYHYIPFNGLSIKLRVGLGFSSELNTLIFPCDKSFNISSNLKKHKQYGAFSIEVLLMLTVWTKISSQNSPRIACCQCRLAMFVAIEFDIHSLCIIVWPGWVITGNKVHSRFWVLFAATSCTQRSSIFLHFHLTRTPRHAGCSESTVVFLNSHSVTHSPNHWLCNGGPQRE